MVIGSAPGARVPPNDHVPRHHGEVGSGTCAAHGGWINPPKLLGPAEDDGSVNSVPLVSQAP